MTPNTLFFSVGIYMGARPLISCFLSVGIYTGSKTGDRLMDRDAFPGSRITNSSVVVIKTHGCSKNC